MTRPPPGRARWRKPTPLRQTWRRLNSWNRDGRQPDTFGRKVPPVTSALPHSRLHWTRPLVTPLVPVLLCILVAGPGQRVIVDLLRGPVAHVCACSLSSGHVCRCAKCLDEETQFDESEPAGYHATDCADDGSAPSLNPVAKMLQPVSPEALVLVLSHIVIHVASMRDRPRPPPVLPRPIRVAVR